MERIKAYFEEAIKTDPALAEAYKPEKLEECWKYIISQAKKQAKNNCAMIEDSEVFKWARDFMYGDIQEEKKTEPMQILEVIDEPVKEEPEAVRKPKMEDGFEVYGEYEEEKTEDPFEDIPEEIEVKPEEEEKPAITHVCGICGYFNGNEQYPSGACIFHHKSVIKAEIACNEFIATPAAIEKAVEIKPTEQKTKKSKKKDEYYDGPSLFDDLF